MRVLSRVPLFVATLVAFLPGHVDGADAWRFPTAYRMPVSIPIGAIVRPGTPTGVSLDFASLRASSIVQERLDVHSIRVVDTQTGKTLPHTVTGDFFHTDKGSVWWRIPSMEARQFQIYFDPIDPQSGYYATLHDGPEQTGLIGIGDRFHYNNGRPGEADVFPLHAQFWLIDWDNDERLDLLGFGLRTYELGADLDRNMGNRIYFYKNVGSTAAPLFAPPQSLRDRDGKPVSARTLGQNVTPTDWDGDGHIDFAVSAECPSDEPRGAVLHLFDRSFVENMLPIPTAGKIELQRH